MFNIEPLMSGFASQFSNAVARKRKKKKKKMAEKELRRKGRSRISVRTFIGNGEDYEVWFEGSLKSLPRSMIERESSAA